MLKFHGKLEQIAMSSSANKIVLEMQEHKWVKNYLVSFRPIGGLRARTVPWFFGHFWKCSEVVDNYFWTLSKMAEKSRDRSWSEPFNYM